MAQEHQPPPTKEGDPRQRRPSGTREGYLLAITPPHDAGIRGLTADPVRVRAAADSGFAAMLTALKGRRALSVMRNAGDRSR